MGFIWVVGNGVLRMQFSIGKIIYRILLCIALATAAPTITFPINSQVPPVARVSIPFIFTFSPSTFYSSSPLTYTLSNAPKWLSLDGSTRTLSGTAPESDADTAPIIQITANDNTGSATMNTTLVVSRSPAPTVVIPLEDQLAKLGAYSPPSSILYYPSSHFKISFDPGTFSTTNLNHYAVTQENTPLPSWISFDGSTLSFSGTTPNSSSLVQPPQNFALQLIASDVLGFAGTAIDFNIVVGNHMLEFKNEFLIVNATVGMAVDFTDLTGGLELDGKSANDSDIASVNATTPDWLNVNNSTFELTGTPPVGAKSSNISVMVTDIYGDTANAIVAVKVLSPIFTGPIGLVNATIGTLFSRTLKPFIWNVSDVIVSVDVSPPIPWLSFNAQALNLSGNVPSDIGPSNILITVHAVSKSSRAAESQAFTINIIHAPQKSTATSSTQALSRTATATASITNATLSGTDSIKRLSKGQIVAIVVPVVLVSSATLLFCFWYNRRRRRIPRKRNGAPEKRDISNPIRIPSQSEEEVESRDRVDSSNAYTNTIRSSNRHTEALRRHSQAMSSLAGNISTDLRESGRSSGTRRRSYSENALSEFGTTWRHTQDSAYPPLRISGRRSSTARNSAARNTRNFSRKTSAPTSYATDRSSGDMIGSSISERMSKASKSSIQRTPDFAYDAESINKMRIGGRKTPNYLGIPSFGRRLSGLGHGSQNSITGFTSVENKRRSGGIGHGTSKQTYEIPSNNPPRGADSWFGGGRANAIEQHRQSAMSALTESTEVLNSPKKMTVRQVPRSPSLPPSVQLSLSSGFSRPVSRRTVGSSPFFAGSSRTVSRGTSRKSLKSIRNKYLYHTSPLVREQLSNGGLEKSIIHGLRDIQPKPQETPPGLIPDALGITYGSPQEGTRQLASYVSQLSSVVSSPTRNSFQFSDSDSRFQSAEPSPRSRHQESFADEGSMQYERSDYGPSPPSDASPSSFNRDRYGVDESPQIAEAMGARATRPSMLAPLRRNLVVGGRESPRREGQERLMSSPARPASSHVQAVGRNASLAASYFDPAGVEGANEEADVSVGSIHHAFL